MCRSAIGSAALYLKYNYMLIKNITHAQTGETRTDGRYPLRIGSTVEFYFYPQIGHQLYLKYHQDNVGNPKGGFLITSPVKHVSINENTWIIKTENSVYYLEGAIQYEF